MFNLNAQNLIQDTLVISINELKHTEDADLVIDKIIDARDAPDCFIGWYEVKKYWFVPVDLVIMTDRPVAESLGHLFRPQSSINSEKIQIIINRLSVDKNTNSLFYPHYRLNASIQLAQLNSENQAQKIGQFIYESIHREPFWGDNLQDGFESVFTVWLQDFARDMVQLQKNNLLYTENVFENFRQDITDVKWINFYAGIDYIYGFRDRLIDGELYFSHREARNKFYRSGYGLRYRMADNFESIEFGSSVDYLMYRISRSFIFQLKSQLFLGANRWKDYQRKDHEIYDIFIGDLSFNQSIILNPLDKTSCIVGLGLSEDLTYIYSYGFKLNLGFLVHLGFKL